MATAGQRRSRQQEIRAAREHGGVRNPGSGNTWRHGNDVRTPRFSREYKITSAASFQITVRNLRTAERNAVLDGREFAFIVEMAGRQYAVIDAALLDELEPPAEP